MILCLLSHQLFYNKILLNISGIKVYSHFIVLFSFILISSLRISSNREIIYQEFFFLNISICVALLIEKSGRLSFQ